MPTSLILQVSIILGSARIILCGRGKGANEEEDRSKLYLRTWISLTWLDSSQLHAGNEQKVAVMSPKHGAPSLTPEQRLWRCENDVRIATCPGYFISPECTLRAYRKGEEPQSPQRRETAKILGLDSQSVRKQDRSPTGLQRGILSPSDFQRQITSNH